MKNANETKVDMLYPAQLGCMAQLVLLCQMSHKNKTAEAKYNPKKGRERDRSSVLIEKGNQIT